MGRGQQGGGEGCVENQKEGTKRAVRRQAAVLHPEDGGVGCMGGVGGVATSKRRLGEPPRCRLRACCVGTGCSHVLSGSAAMLALGLNCPTLTVMKSPQIGILKGDLSQKLMKSLSQGSYSTC